MFVYHNVEVVRVIDGDTVALRIDMGNKTHWQEKFRLYGIDAPERGTPGYEEASTYLKELLGNRVSYVETFRPDKYGRWLANIHISTEQGGYLLVNSLMLVNNHAKPYFGGTKQ